jgi:hypothetical protein
MDTLTDGDKRAGTDICEGGCLVSHYNHVSVDSP